MGYLLFESDLKNNHSRRVKACQRQSDFSQHCHCFHTLCTAGRWLDMTTAFQSSMHACVFSVEKNLLVEGCPCVSDQSSLCSCSTGLNPGQKQKCVVMVLIVCGAWLSRIHKRKEVLHNSEGPQIALPARHKLKQSLYMMEDISYAIMCPEFFILLLFAL